MDPVAAKELGRMIGAGIAAIGMGGAAIGVAFIFGNYLSSALRNPAAAQEKTAPVAGTAAQPTAKPGSAEAGIKAITAEYAKNTGLSLLRGDPFERDVIRDSAQALATEGVARVKNALHLGRADKS